ncbi:ABC transporter substrate-binding protein [Halomonas salifodinae]|uniref:ABC transporter substrate-binding protein n=1 Tax=Halomonas salifodinae TaxID=438745 RepID=UPI0033B0DE64
MSLTPQPIRRFAVLAFAWCLAWHSFAMAEPVVDEAAIEAARQLTGDSQERRTPAPSRTDRAPEPIAPPPLRELKVMLEWYLGLQHAPWILARERGDFERQALTVELMPPADPELPTKLLMTERIDLALGRQPQLHLESAAGHRLVRVATLIDSPVSGLVMRQDNGIDSPLGLAEGPLAYAVADSALVARTMLAHHGIALNDERLVHRHFGLGQALLAGEAVAVVAPLWITLEAQLAEEGLNTRQFLAEEHGLPPFDGLILMAHQERLAALRDDIMRLVTALESATLWALNHPEEAWALLVASEPSLDSTANRRAWPSLLARLAPSPAALNEGRYARFERFLVATGQLESARAPHQLAIDPAQ